MRQQQIRFIAILLITVFAAVSRAQEVHEATSLKTADQMMSQGDCENAIPLYRIAYRNISDTFQKIDILLKASDCAVQISELTFAGKILQLASKLAPEDDRVKLKISEFLFHQRKYMELIELPNGKKPVESALKAEHDILVGRSFLEMENYEKGLQILDSIPIEKETASVLLYWKAVALFNLEHYKKSGLFFRKSIETAAPNEWTIDSSRSWLDLLREVEKVFYPKLRLGVLYESNLSGRSYSDSNTIEGNPSSYLRDGGLSVDFSGLYFLVKKNSSKLYISPEFSQILYAKYYAYHFSSMGARAGLDYQLSERLLMGLQISFAKTKYNFIDYQDIRTSSGFLKWQLNRKVSLSYTADFVNFERNPSLYAFSHSIYLNRDIANLTYWAGLQYRESRGTQAQVVVNPGQFPLISRGELFSRYRSTGLLLGSSRNLERGKSVAVQITHLKTVFAEENFPTSADSFVSSKENRIDHQWSLFGSYTWPLTDYISQSIGANLLVNKSVGFQGFSNGKFPSSNYDSQTLTYQVLFGW